MSKLLVIDTETGGLDPNKNSILSIGGVVLDEGAKPIDEFEFYIKETNIFAEQRALDINKIDLKWLNENGKSPKEVVQSMEYFLSKHYKLKDEKITIVGQNVGFDVGFVKRLYRLVEKNYEDIFSYRSIDTASILRFLNLAGKINIATGGLGEALDYFGINKEVKHSALADAKDTAALLSKMLERIK